MQKFITTIFTLSLTLSVFAQSRYLDSVFVSVKTDSAIVYGQAEAISAPYFSESWTWTQDLLMDVYQPQGDFVSKLQDVLNDPNIPKDVARDIGNIINRVSADTANIAAKPGLTPGTTVKYTTAKGSIIDAKITGVKTADGRVNIQPLKNGKPTGATYSVPASKLQSSGDSRSLAIASPNKRELMYQQAGNLPATYSGNTTDPGYIDADFEEVTPGEETNAALPGGSSNSAATPGKTGFLSKIKGALSKGWGWVKNNKWKSLLYAGGLAALAGIAIFSGPAAAGAAIIKAATSLPTAVATGAGALAGGYQAYQQAGAEGQTGKERFKSTLKGGLKKGAQAFAGGVAGGVIGQGAGTLINSVMDRFKGAPGADIGAPGVSGPQRTIDPNNPQAPDYRTAAANNAETLGPKGVDRFNRYAGATDAQGNVIPGRKDWGWNEGSPVDQGRKYVQQVSNEVAPGMGDKIFNSYEEFLRTKLGNQEKAVTGLADLIKSLEDSGDTNTIKQIATGKLDFGQLLSLIKQTINASYEYKGDSQMLWEAYKDINRS